jgi:uncharacterized membrane protein YkoI
MHPLGSLRVMALVACAMFALSISNVAYASDREGSSGSDRTESSSGSGGGGDSGHSDKPDKPESTSGDNGGDDGGDDDGNESNNNSGSGSPGSVPSSVNSTVLRTGTVANQDEALSAVTTGKAVSLPLLLAFMANKFPGEIVDIKLKNKAGQYSYVVEYLSSTAKLSIVTLNAKTLGKL